MSNHSVEVVPVELKPHPNADRLSLVNIFDGYVYCANTEDWKGVTKAAYIPPDSLVDTRRPEFAFFAKDAKYDENSNNVKGPYYRIRAKRIRGIVSYGFMVPVDNYRIIGEDLSEPLGIKHYEPPLNIPGNKQKNHFLTGGEVESGPNLYHVKYDVDNFQRYALKVFRDGEAVSISEKIHGANGKWVYHNDRFYCGSRTEWKREFAKILVPDRDELRAKVIERDGVPEKFTSIDEYVDHILASIKNKNENPLQNMWWKALRATPALMEWLQKNPDIIVYGEVYGSVQNLRYGVPQGQVRIGVFDLLKGTTWIDVEDARDMSKELPWVPLIDHNVPFDFDKLVALAEGESLVPGAKHYREGIVVKPLKERTDPGIGRVQLKIVSPTYLEKS